MAATGSSERWNLALLSEVQHGRNRGNEQMLILDWFTVGARRNLFTMRMLILEQVVQRRSHALHPWIVETKWIKALNNLMAYSTSSRTLDSMTCFTWISLWFYVILLLLLCLFCEKMNDCLKSVICRVHIQCHFCLKDFSFVLRLSWYTWKSCLMQKTSKFLILWSQDI